MAQLENFRLKVFRAVAEHVNFHKAAEQLFLTQPAVTLQIKALESDLGVHLINLFPRDLNDRILHAIGRLFPSHLPARIKDYRNKYQHHLLLKMAGKGIGEAGQFLESFFPSGHGAFFECTQEEGEKPSCTDS